VAEWVTADALEVLADVAYCRTFDLIAASPPCQGYSVTRHMTGRSHPMLIDPVRQLLERIGQPYVIENVEGAAWSMRSPVLICGTSLGLGALCDDGLQRQLQRHRLFESDLDLAAPGTCNHALPAIGVYAHGAQRPKPGSPRGYGGSKAEAMQAMGIDWMRRDDLSQAIPPAYTEWIGREALFCV
jgi:DNA (cytosine-5)-methyltransferase 1